MLRAAAIALIVLGGGSTAAAAQDAGARTAMFGGVHACRQWVFEPKSWAGHEAGFAARIGLAGKLVPIARLPVGVLSPGLVARADRFWRIDAGRGNGVFVAASTKAPVCNVAAGGPSDLQPAAQSVVAAIALDRQWRKEAERGDRGMIMASFRARADQRQSMIVSCAARAGDRTDRVQFLATITYQTGR